MKKVFLLGMWLTITITSFSQQLTPSQTPTREYYLKRSEAQHTGALVLLIGGGCLLAAGGIWGISRSNDNDASFSDLDAPGAIALVGIASMLGSIPLFIASHRNAKKARDISFHFKSIRSIPGLTVKISL